jgi:hypothetical protein
MEPDPCDRQGAPGAPLASQLKAWRAARGAVRLRRVYEHVLIDAVIEGARPVRRSCYDGYVDALQLLSARMVLVTKDL